ncbi:hypothetical protein XENTR_v10000236 [Xenopus tropicalis]|nr:hypothetical protein XENTR_v10000236 [Xenopus tropicalis]
MGSCCAGEGTMAAAAHHYKCALITGQKSRNVPTMTGADSRGTNGFPVPAEAESALQRLRYLGHSLSHLQNKGNVQYKETIQDSHSHILGRRVPRPLVKVQVIGRYFLYKPINLYCNAVAVGSCNPRAGQWRSG